DPLVDVVAPDARPLATLELLDVRAHGVVHVELLALPPVGSLLAGLSAHDSPSSSSSSGTGMPSSRDHASCALRGAAGSASPCPSMRMSSSTMATPCASISRTRKPLARHQSRRSQK